jgi:rhodanese-related sulfurtransferase
VVDLDEAKRLFAAGSYYFVDTRSVDPEQVPYIPGAFFIRQDSFDNDLLAASDFIYPEDPLILYGEGNLQLVAAVAARLQERGYENLSIMAGGLAAWRKAGGSLIVHQESNHD